MPDRVATGFGSPTPLLSPDRHPDLERFFYGIGAQKAGTTWLYGTLARHPGCHFPPRKEVRYWDWRVDKADRWAFKVADRAMAEGRRQIGRAVLRPWHLPRAAARLSEARNYRALLRRAGTPEGADRYARYLMRGYRGAPVAGEITPNYSLLDREDFARMAATHPDTRFVFLLRDPVARLWSGIKHRFRLRLAAGERVDGEMVAAFRAALRDPGDVNRRRGDYGRTLDALHDAVPADRVLVLFYERLFEDAYFRRVTDFLGLDPIAVDAEYRPNESRRRDLHLSETDRRMAFEVLAPIYEDMRLRFGSDIPDVWQRADAMMGA